MTVEVNADVVMWVVGGILAFIIIVCGGLYSWIKLTSARLNSIEVKMATFITEERAEKITRDIVTPVSESVNFCRKDVARLAHELHETVNVIRTNMSDLMLKLVGK
jgi:ubiquinone biosynthesis protein UbiJ